MVMTLTLVMKHIMCAHYPSMIVVMTLTLVVKENPRLVVVMTLTLVILPLKKK